MTNPQEATFEIGGAKLSITTEALFRAWLAQNTAAPAAAISHSLPALNDGEVNAGLILNEDGTPSHYLILLPGERDEIDHADAIAWAASIGGELPSRREQSLLFANAKKHFAEAWYWSAEVKENGWAWSQRFSLGHQYCLHTNNALRARAVRRLFIR